MGTAWILLVALACPVMMGLMMLFMGRRMKRRGKHKGDDRNANDG